MRSRTPTDSDWPDIRALADQALPQAPDANRAWITARQAFSRTGTAGLHRLFEGDDGDTLGFGALEASEAPGAFRLFLVMHPDTLAQHGDAAVADLLGEAASLGAKVVWMREHADDPLIAFMRRHGFEESQRYVLGPEHGAYAGVEVIEIQCRR
jgi:hypothetical protein